MIQIFLCSLAMPSGQNLFFAQTGTENTRMRMKMVIYFVNDEKVMQKQRVLNFDHKDQYHYRCFGCEERLISETHVNIRKKDPYSQTTN